jgi:DsbC/DsbD-like thiol-disulfide interchange protein
LQTTAAAKSSRLLQTRDIVGHNNQRYVTFCRPLPVRTPLHDQFSGARCGSILNVHGMTAELHCLRPIAAACAAAMLFASNAASAAEASRWDGDERSAVRLIAGSNEPARSSEPLRAGIEIRLKTGWHTYWRYPGDAGIPPRFDFTGSDNVKTVEVLWPAPRRLPVGGSVSIGYEDHVILPLRVMPQDHGRAVLLRLKLDYAICEKLCVPVTAKAELAISGGRASHDAALATAEAQVPMRVRLGEARTITIKSIVREAGGRRGKVVVDVVAPAGAPVELFAEGPTSDWALPLPEPVRDAPAGIKRYVFDLDGAPPGASYEGVEIRLTAAAGKDAVELSTRLD